LNPKWVQGVGSGRVQSYTSRTARGRLGRWQGAHPKFVSEHLGHASSQITLDRYSHLLDQSYSDESEKLEAALFAGRPLEVVQVGRPRVLHLPARYCFVT